MKEILYQLQELKYQINDSDASLPICRLLIKQVEKIQSLILNLENDKAN